MPKQMDKAINALKSLPEDRQRELVDHILELAHPSPRPLTEQEQADIDEGLAAADAGDFASQDEWNETSAIGASAP